MNDCTQHAGLEAEIEGFKDWKKEMTKSDGIIEKLWGGVGTKMDKVMVISLLGAMLAITGSSFGLVYYTQLETLREVSKIMVNVTTIQQVEEDHKDTVDRVTHLETSLLFIKKQLNTHRKAHE